jgi:hypothetical protein
LDNLEEYNKEFYKISSIFNINNILNFNPNSPAAIIGVLRKKDKIALKDAAVITDKSGQYKLGAFSNKNPYNFKYLPELIDSYPLNSHVEPSIGMVYYKK